MKSDIVALLTEAMSVNRTESNFLESGSKAGSVTTVTAGSKLYVLIVFMFNLFISVPKEWMIYYQLSTLV